ncbi:hypothetical protein ACERK3_19040 [Phycisphaerales bacterium AB-hyl4]|uniref:Uncharacterized protein n=1 Tax=Natronomicrosphaera hydrolytica TaxID=3242702 RepID=A0ABV4UBL2_9BACT
MQPADKKALISDVGEKLVRRHGKQKHYKPAQVRRAALDAGYIVDVHCWAYCFFCSAADFLTWHQARGETCDYAAMKVELARDLAGETGSFWFDVDLSWLDWPDVDLSSIFDWFDVSP